MRGLVEDAGEVLLGLADVLRDHHRQVDPVDVEPRLAAEQRRGQRLAGAGRAVEQRAVAGREGAPQAPAVEDARLVREPGGDVLDLVEHLRAEHEVVPAEPGGEPAGREVGRVVGPAGAAGREQRRLVARQRQRAGRHRRAGAGAVEDEETAGAQRVLGRERRHRRRPRREVGAGEQEQRGVAGGLEGAALRRRPAAELGERPLERAVAHEERVEDRRLQVRGDDERQHQARLAVEARGGDQRPERRGGVERGRRGQDVAAAAAGEEGGDPRLDRRRQPVELGRQRGDMRAGHGDGLGRAAGDRFKRVHGGVIQP